MSEATSDVARLPLEHHRTSGSDNTALSAGQNLIALDVPGIARATTEPLSSENRVLNRIRLFPHLCWRGRLRNDCAICRWIHERAQAPTTGHPIGTER